MNSKSILFLFLALLVPLCSASAQTAEEQIESENVTIRLRQQFDVLGAGDKSAFEIRFELEKGWHFYASAESAPGGMNLKLTPEAGGSDYIDFSEPLFPESRIYYDKTLGRELQVYSGTFNVFIPFEISDRLPEREKEITVPVTIAIDGAICSENQCRVPDFDNLKTIVTVKPSTGIPKAENLQQNGPKFTLPEKTDTGQKQITSGKWSNYPIWLVLLISIGVGMTFNIMPCVWPVLPLIITRLVEQAKQPLQSEYSQTPDSGIKSKIRNQKSTIILGLVFCTGIILFFAALAGLNIVLRVFYGTVLQWGDQFRDPVFLGFMVLLLVVLALFMFDIFTISVPVSVASGSEKKKGLYGAMGTGFLAAILSTPCSFGILAAVFAWAQGQNLIISTLVLLFMGLGMALPYGILTPFSGALKHLPRGGRWMSAFGRFKQALGFLFLFLAVWLLTALPAGIRTNVMYFAVLLALCVWMWGSWVSFYTPAPAKWTVRTTAVIIAVAGGIILLPPEQKKIDWQKYDSQKIQQAGEESRPVLIKFTAEWCLSCKVVDKAVFDRDDIAELIKKKNVLPVKADTTSKSSPATKALKNTYNEPGVPVTILLLPDKKEPVRFHEKFFAEKLKEYLRKLPAE